MATQLIELKDIRRGSIVCMRGMFGSGPATVVEVTEVFEDVKNGQPGFDYRIEHALGTGWAYLRQIDHVIKF